jgi:hypothetical protein
MRDVQGLAEGVPGLGAVARAAQRGPEIRQRARMLQARLRSFEHARGFSQKVDAVGAGFQQCRDLEGDSQRAGLPQVAGLLYFGSGELLGALVLSQP